MQEGDRVVLLEDVTTTGGSAIKCADVLEEVGCHVIGCITILDREEGGVTAFRERAYPSSRCLGSQISQVIECPKT